MFVLPGRATLDLCVIRLVKDEHDTSSAVPYPGTVTHSPNPLPSRAGESCGLSALRFISMMLAY